METLALICARGGSKGIPRKNIRLLCGKPLIAHTIETALQCKALDRIIVSTDDSEIRDVSLKHGAEVPFVRPSELATDCSDKWAVWKHAVVTLEQQEGYLPDIIVDLDPTAPLRQVADIEGCLRTLREEDADIVITICEASKNPYFNMVEYHGEYVRLCKTAPLPITGRQQAPKVFAMNASIYAMWRSFVLGGQGVFAGRTKAYLMPPERSVDIDRDIEFAFVEFLMRHRKSVLHG